MNSIYDQRPTHTFNLASKANELVLTPKAHRNSILINMKAHDSKVIISFSSSPEAAYWIRCVAEFTTALPTKKDVAKQYQYRQCRDDSMVDCEQQRSSSLFGSVQRSYSKAMRPSEALHAAGTGNTADYLSSMAGI